MDNSSENWKLVIGLGNPGQTYARTYHNAGEMAVTAIAGSTEGFRKPFSVWRGKPFSYLKVNDVIFMKPTTYMNESGKAIASAMKHFGITEDEIVIIHDDSDLPLGEYKAEKGRGSAGHNGIKSAIQYLGNQDFWRIRLGVRTDEGVKAGDLVLKKIPPRETERLYEVISDIKTRYFE